MKPGNSNEPREATTVAEGDEVIFTPDVPADDEFVVTESASAENDIKSALGTIDNAGASTSLDFKFEHIGLTGEPSEKDVMRDSITILEGKVKSDGSTASYYELPEDAEQLQDLISHRNMNAQLGEIFRECYRYGLSSHCDELRGAKKIKFYIDAEIARLKKLAK